MISKIMKGRAEAFKETHLFRILFGAISLVYIASLIANNIMFEGIVSLFYIPSLVFWSFDWSNKSNRFVLVTTILVLALVFVIGWVKIIG